MQCKPKQQCCYASEQLVQGVMTSFADRRTLTRSLVVTQTQTTTGALHRQGWLTILSHPDVLDKM